MLTKQDIDQIVRHGLTPADVEQQINRFKRGFQSLPVVRAATIGDGIRVIPSDRIRSLTELYDVCSEEARIVKFVPASGAATRMFKELFEFVNDAKRSPKVDSLLANLDKFAFRDDLKTVVGDHADDTQIVSAIVGQGLGYGASPKALILFHSYPDGKRTALEEHLAEGALYAASHSKQVRKNEVPVHAPAQVYIHFTVSPEHREGFEKKLNAVVAHYEKKFGVQYHISFSYQDPATDTVAVTPDNELFRDGDGSLVFRPAGHGALLKNLNEIDADVVFIKTVDNVQPDRLKTDTIRYKKALGGVLFELQKKVFGYLEKTDRKGANDALNDEIARFVETELCNALPGWFHTQDAAGKSLILREILNRPIRVCGMVRNEGEPGGGPFWVKTDQEIEKLQIAESSQIAPEQIGLMREATHFNPVDLVCGVRDYKGEKFDLMKFVDPETGFISSKSKDGSVLQALELPGLWNGAMAKWNTVFVEVPITTFTPVKVVNDLLRPQHQN